MYELNLSPGFRADEANYAEFDAMAKALPGPPADGPAAAAGDRRPRHQARLAEIAAPTLVIHGTEDR